MLMNMYLSECCKTEVGVAPRDLNTGAFTGTYFPVAQHRRVTATLVSAALAAGKKITVQLMKAKDAAGTGATAFTDPVDYVSTAGGTGLVQAEAVVENLGDTFTHVAVRVSTDNGASVYGAAALQLYNSRFNPQ